MSAARKPPRDLAHNAELERANLEHMLTHPEDLPEMRAVLSPRDFYDGFNRNVYEAILKAQDDGAPLDHCFVSAVRARLIERIPEMPNAILGTALARLIVP